ncbi:tRNA pseudouridine(38-40) synthase TruA [Catalinimonas niigatensis]|uniref:tRNA pseudouridine(38-40) synthase TruA n=1 Tax=Catalinimonas niigatensis TaxID=1397264 RepID=UPI0026670510|nr:tRNA pseudouridine(38-40) synthase TruA [Catalinimonas niigatensis]WPP49428.1 tRNA pseudouridine(38-40) synthase TruA [Catalinimonas niigatensis]
MRYFIKIKYKGTQYHGWQIQANATSIQAVLSLALSQILREDISLSGSGRTDTGVHALQQYAHFDTTRTLNLQEHMHKFNALLPHDISIQEILPVKDEAHSRFDAYQRSYQYHIHQHKDPFLHEFSYLFRPELDLDRMNLSATWLVTGKERDYACFSKSRSSQETSLCRIDHAEWVRIDPYRLVFHITANRFLRNMVRAIVGTMLDIGTHKMSHGGFEAILHSKDRKKAGRSVPAQGLYLSQVNYPGEIFL